VVVAFFAVCAAQALSPAAGEPLAIAGVSLLPLFLIGLLVCAAAPVARYRRAGEDERLRLRWVFLGGASLPLTLLLCWSSYLVLGTADLVGVGLVLMYLAIPIGVAVALVRPTLFDVDRASVATITAGTLSAAVLVVLSAASLLVGSALVAWSPPVALGSTAVLAAGAVLSFRPLYRLLDRLVFPERGRAVSALRSLQALVDAGRAAPADVEPTLRESLRDPGLEVAYARLSDAALLRFDGTPTSASELSAPVRLRGDLIGVLTASPGRGARPSVAVARAAAALLDAARLQAELDAARAEVVASRERLVRAGFEEQRRLERDLHDGAQQRLVALGMRLRVLQRSGAVPAAASSDLDAAVAELGTAVAELRRLAQGVRPSALEDGLAAALTEIAARTPGLVDLDVRASEVPDAVAVTAYFVVSEAVANALKHAGAERIRIVVESAADRLRLTIADDGRGGARARGGLTHMADRVDALGGTLSISSPPGDGTRIEAVLPCGS
jgi:signal transduction histidine kinase